jgi:hypothetical protein
MGTMPLGKMEVVVGISHIVKQGPQRTDWKI